MLHVHQKGVGVCGVYTLEVAEAKVPKPSILPGRTITRFSARLKKTTSLRQIFLPISANCSHCRLDFSR